jgi:hypothetical protein
VSITPPRSPRVVCCLLLSLAGAAGLAAQNDHRQNGDLPGIEHNGRIPKVELPVKLDHPERWRYIPEGRLVEGNILERFLVTSFFSPIVFREADVGTGGGVAITDIDFRNKRRQEFANFVITYTSEGQQTFSANWRRWNNHIELPDGGVIQDERSFTHVHTSYSKSLTSRYFGRGIHSRPVDESSYTHERSVLELRYQFTEPHPADALVIRVGTLLEHNNLARGRVEDALQTQIAYAPEFLAGDDHDLLWLNASIRYDTRDSLHNPYDGFYVGTEARAAVLQSGGEVGAVFTASGGKTFTVPPLLHDGGDDREEHPPTDSLAIGGFVEAASGELPFYTLPNLGGSRTLRGYINNRFTDRTAWHLGAEYRFWTVPRGFQLTKTVRIERLGLALFGEVGSVAPKVGDLLNEIEHSYGIGFRLSLERTALFRFDLGFSEEDANLSIAYGLTF